MAGKSTPRHSHAAANGAPTLTPLGHYAGRPDIPISRTVTLVGSGPDARLHLHSSTVSKAHCLIVNTASGAYLRDLASRAKVIINGKPHRETDLHDGDKLQIGKFEFQFNAGVPLRAGAPTAYDPAPPAVLHVEGAEMPLAMEDRVMLIGRRATCDVPLTEDSVSTAHAVIFEMNGKRYVRDLGSRTGTFVNDKAINQQAELELGDELKIGETRMTYASPTAAAATASELDDLIAPAAELDASPLDDLAAVVGTADVDVDSAADADAIPLEEPTTVARAPEPAAEAPGDAGMSAIEEELGLAPEIDARSGWRSRVPEEEERAQPAEPPRDEVEIEAPAEETPVEEAPAEKAPVAEAPVEAPIADEIAAEEAAADELAVEETPVDEAQVEEVTVQEATVAESPTAEAPEASREDEVDELAPLGFAGDTSTADAAVEDDVRDEEPVSSKPLPGAVELADLARSEPPADEIVEDRVEAVEEEVKPVDATADTADVSPVEEQLVDEQDVHDEVPPAPVALEAPLAADDEPEFDIGELPSLELSDAAHEGEQAASVVDDVREDTLDLTPLAIDESSHGEADERAELELKLPDVTEEPPAPPAPEAEAAPEAAEDAERAAPKFRRPRRKKGEPVEISLPEPTAAEEPAPFEPAAAAEEPVAASDEVEVLDRTQPTPESAQSLEDAVADILSEAPDAPEESPLVSSELSDTAFGRNVEAFAGESTGPLVEARNEERVEVRFQETVEEPIPAELAVDASGDDSLHDTPFSVEEPAAVGLESDTAGQSATAIDDELAAAEALAADVLINDAHEKLDAATVDETPEEAQVAPPPLHQQTAEPVAEATELDEAPELEVNITEAAPEPVAEAPAPAPAPQAKPEPVAEAPKKPQIDLTGWGPNQEHFLGGMPLQLGEPAPPPRKPAQPMRPAAEAPRPTPPRPTRAQPKRKGSPFEITPGDVPAEDLGRTIPPFTGTNPRKGRVTTGFDGLAMPPVRQTDVFSQMATPAAFVNGILGDDVFGGKKGGIPQGKVAPIGAPARAPSRGATAAEHPAPHADAQPAHPGSADATANGPEQWADASADAGVATAVEDSAARRGARQPGRAQVPPTIPPNAAEAYPAPPRKRRWFKVPWLLVMMLVCMGAAVAAIYAFVPPRAVVQGWLVFRNVEALTEKEQRELKERQQQLLATPALRDNALNLLRTNEPDATPGFLGDPVEFSKSVSEVKWDGGTMVFRHDGTTPDADRARVHAVLTALYQSNGDIVEDARKLKGRVDALSDAHAKAQQRVAELKSAIDRTRASAENRPEPTEIAALEHESAKLEAAWGEAVANVKNIEVDLKRMREGISPTPQPAGTANVPVIDDQLAGLEKNLADLNKQVAEMQQARTGSAEDARKQLDAALATFEKDVAAAAAAPAGPEVKAYLTRAQELQQTTRELTDQLIRRQQQNQEKLTELKARLNEKRDARRDEQIQKDPQLKEWNDQLAITQRQHSAAVSAGLTNDAEEFRTQADTLKKMIASRQALIGDDQLVADAIAELEKIIADTTNSLDADRKSTEATLDQLQQTFVQSQPPVEKLPADQRQIAAALNERLAAVTEARRAYTRAIGPSVDDEQLQKLRDEAATLATTIADRKRQLAAASEKTQLAAAEQGRIEEVKKRETELAAAREAERQAQAAWAASVKKLHAAQIRITEARAAGETIDRYSKERDAAQAELELNLRTLEAARAQLAKKVDPLPPRENDVRIEPGTNVRPTYSLVAVGAIAALFTVLILFSVRADRSASAAVAESRPLGDDDWGDRAEPILTHGNGRPDAAKKPGRHEDEATVSV